MENLIKKYSELIDEYKELTISPKFNNSVYKREIEASIGILTDVINDLKQNTLPPSIYDWTTHGDFKKYYDIKAKRNFWLLGYFGGGAVKIIDAFILAKQYAESVGIPMETVVIDEIFMSRRYKGFKYIFSAMPDQKPESDAIQMENVLSMLYD